MHHNSLLSNNNNSNSGQTEQIIAVFSISNESPHLNYTDLRSKQTNVTAYINDTNQDQIDLHDQSTLYDYITRSTSDLRVHYEDGNSSKTQLQETVIQKSSNANIPAQLKPIENEFTSDNNFDSINREKLVNNFKVKMKDETVKLMMTDSDESNLFNSTDAVSNLNFERIEQRLSLDNDQSWANLGNKFSAEAREVEEAADYGLRMMNELIRVREPELYRMGLSLMKDDPADKVASFNAPNRQAVRLARYGYASLQASTRLVQQLSMTGDQELRTTPLHMSPELRDSLRGTALHNECPFRGPVPCRPAARRYRTSDGTCNNRELPKRGSALTPQQRFLRPRYDDGIQTIRRSVVDHAPLPSAREVSTRIHRDRHLEAPSVTLMLMQWGQFIDHDITATPQSRAFNGSTPRCCADGGREFQPLEFMHPECLPISVPNDDWFLSRFQIRCLEFVRSAPAPREECDFGHRQQINQVTSFIDGSTIYGSSASQSDAARLFRGGMVQYGRLDNRNPPDPVGGELCRMGAISNQCFRGGDFRASEQPALTAMHITWVRKHNSLATRLTELNGHWSDEKTYQETRRIIGAMLQHITFREFLPIILGHEVMSLFDLELVSKGYYTGYDENVNPALANSFTAAAYRFGHSLIQKSFMRSDRLHRPIFNNVSLHEEQSNPENIWSTGSLDRLLLGMSNQPSQRRDEFISDELTNHLFQSPGFPFGLDLAALNIQRGRDHGVPPYTAWRIPCGLSPINNWTDLQRVTSPETSQRFRSLYLSVDDIDLYSAGLAERPVRGGLVGPTFACIIAQQFSNLKKGDRFWYENGNFESSFTPAQLQQIRKTTLSQIICETMGEVDTIQPFVFLSADDLQNQRQTCRNFLNFNMTPWIEIFSDPDAITFSPTGTNIVETKSKLTDSDIIRIKREEREDYMEVTNSHNLSVTNKSNKTNRHNINDDIRNDDVLLLAKQHLQLDITDNLPTAIDNIQPLIELELAETIDYANGTMRAERKRKVPNTRRKPKPNRNKNSTLPTKLIYESTTAKSKKKSNKTRTTLKHASYTSTNTFTIDRNVPNKRPSFYQQQQQQQQQNPYYSINDYLSNGQYPYDDDLTVVMPTKRPKPVTHLFNTVKKKTATSTTPKPDYQLNIQINYFYNTTTESYEFNRPTRPNDFNNRPAPNVNFNQPPTQSYYDYKNPTKRPTNINNANTYNNNDEILTYNSQDYYNHYANQRPEPYYTPNDKIDFGQANSRYTTYRPYSTATSHPMTVIDVKPPIYLQPQTVQTKRPAVHVINAGENFDQNKPNGGYGIYHPMANNVFYDKQRPTYNYDNFNDHSSYDQNRPSHNARPQTIIHKRPVTGEVTKLDTKPFVVYNPTQYNKNTYYGTETKYDNDNTNYQTGTRPTLNINKNQESTYSSLNDKLDFSSSKKYVKISSARHSIFTTPKPLDDRQFVRISTNKGQISSTNPVDKVYVTIQKKESEADLDMTYDELFEVYLKPDSDTANANLTEYETKKDIWKIYNATSDIESPLLPLPKPNDNDLCSTELPKPMHLLLDDDLL